MPHLWLRDESQSWTPLPLQSGPLSLEGPAPGVDDRPSSPEAAISEVAFFEREGHGPAGWAILCGFGRGVRVNGTLLAGGIRVLGNRDEIRVEGTGTLFFSTETLAESVPFPAEDGPVACARCRHEIDARAPAVCCPSCKVWHHETEELPCWTYTEHCSLCDQPTALDSGFRWTPEDL